MNIQLTDTHQGSASPRLAQEMLGHTEDTPVPINLLQEVLHFLPDFLLVCFPSDVVFWGDLCLICKPSLKYHV